MTSYRADQDRILMETSGGPVRLTLAQADRLLDIYDEAGATRDFLDLYDAAQKVDGFIPRGCSVRGFEGWNRSSRAQPRMASNGHTNSARSAAGRV